MTRKHFEALARALSKTRPPTNRLDGNREALRLWTEMVSEVASVCASTNSNFRRSTFLEACGSDKC